MRHNSNHYCWIWLAKLWISYNNLAVQEQTETELLTHSKTNLRNCKTGCTTYTNFDVTSKERMEHGILRAEGEHCDFLPGWLDTEILMVEKGKSKRVRRKLLQDQLLLAEVLKYAGGLKSTNEHATKVESQTPTEVTIKQEMDKIVMEKKDKRPCFNCGKHWPYHEGARNCLAFGKCCTHCGKRNHFAKYCKNQTGNQSRIRISIQR